MLDVIDPAALTGPTAMVASLCTAGTVARWRNPDLWDALATAIMRQVIRAGQARKLYRAFSHAYGESVSTPLGHTWLVPTPETVLMLPDAEFARLGMAFKARPLRAAAEAFLEFGAKWAELDSAGFASKVQNVPRVGPWTAGATVADLTNDYALHPFADLAVRTWVKRLAPQRCWPGHRAGVRSGVGAVGRRPVVRLDTAHACLGGPSVMPGTTATGALCTALCPDRRH